ncbi:hypothetical protein C5167_046525 [Papaver somniferum]|uniref:Vesicle-fusing ATPase n=1 Tax=Papaver somniferum TaxID=3469 RepID=A0A4Y7LGH6_PAPSO|nr:hypothetical protein C5167_046525 [Papaver somniferum]
MLFFWSVSFCFFSTFLVIPMYDLPSLLIPGVLFHLKIFNQREDSSSNIIRHKEFNLQSLGTAAWTKNFSGAELEGVVKSIISYSLNRQLSLEDLTKTLDDESIKETMDDFLCMPCSRDARATAVHDVQLIIQAGEQSSHKVS